MLKDKRVKYGLIILLALLALFLLWRWNRSAVEVKIARVEKGSILSTISASGQIEARSLELGSGRMAGRVDWAGVSEGAHVYAGQMLVKFDGYDYAAKEYQRAKNLHAQGFVSERDLERAKLEMEYSCIISPIAGTVTEKTAIVGETVTPGIPIITVVETEKLWGEIQLDEVDISKVRIGQKVRFTTDAFPDKSYFGTINWINRKAELKKVGGRVRMDEEDLVFRAKVTLDGDTEDLDPGMSVYAEVITGEKAEVLTVPREAIILRDGKESVFVLKGRRAKETVVGLGIKDAEKVEIVSGLKETDKVVVSNLEKLKDGTRVRVVK